MSLPADQIDALDSGALFSACRRWRYMLWRRWDPDKGVCIFVGLNPSTADELEDDPTIRRCIRFAKDWGYGSLWMLNAFAFRATDPKVMHAAGGNAVGPLNNEYLIQAGRQAEFVVAAWGVHCSHQDRQTHVVRMMAQARVELHHLGLTKNGAPRHPLYLRADTQPELWATHYHGVPLRVV